MTQEQALKFKVGDVVKVELGGGKVAYGIVYEASSDYGEGIYRVETVLGKLKELAEEKLSTATLAEAKKAWKSAVEHHIQELYEYMPELTPDKVIAREKAEHPNWFGLAPAQESGEVEEEDEE